MLQSAGVLVVFALVAAVPVLVRLFSVVVVVVVGLVVVVGGGGRRWSPLVVFLMLLTLAILSYFLLCKPGFQPVHSRSAG